jgi:hypothetical protein
MQVIPALGLMWSNTVNTRLLLQRRNHSLDGETSTIHRTLDVVLASHLPNISVAFEVIDEGVRGIKEL